MRSGRIGDIAACCLAFLLPALWAGAQAPVYHYTDLGTFGGTSSRAYDINNRGQVTGWAAAKSTKSREYDWVNQRWIERTGNYQNQNAFVYDRGRMIDIGRPDETSVAWAISDSGRVVGTVGRAGNTERAFRSERGPLYERSDIGFLDGAISASNAKAINSQGQTVGNSYAASGSASFIYQNDKMTNLGPLLGSSGLIWDINDSGLVVGDSFLNSTHSGDRHAFILDTRSNQITDLAPALGWPRSYAYAISNNGVVVGATEGTYGLGKGFIYDHGAVKLLNPLPGMQGMEAYAVNERGQVVGRSSWLAFLYDSGQTYDLNKLLDAPLNGWSITEAWGINDKGQIVGFSRDTTGTVEHAFLMTPVGPLGEDVPEMDFGPLEGTFSPSVYLSPFVPEPALLPWLGLAMLAGVRRPRRTLIRSED